MDAVTSNTIFIIRMISEREIKVQTDVFLCFIDYTKVYNKVWKKIFFEL